MTIDLHRTILPFGFKFELKRWGSDFPGVSQQRDLYVDVRRPGWRYVRVYLRSYRLLGVGPGGSRTLEVTFGRAA